MILVTLCLFFLEGACYLPPRLFQQLQMGLQLQADMSSLPFATAAMQTVETETASIVPVTMTISMPIPIPVSRTRCASSDSPDFDGLVPRRGRACANEDDGASTSAKERGWREVGPQHREEITGSLEEHRAP